MQIPYLYGAKYRINTVSFLITSLNICHKNKFYSKPFNFDPMATLSKNLLKEIKHPQLS